MDPNEVHATVQHNTLLECQARECETKWVCFIVSYTIQVMMLCIWPVSSRVLRIRARTCGIDLPDLQRNRQTCTQTTTEGIVGIGAAQQALCFFAVMIQLPQANILKKSNSFSQPWFALINTHCGV
jgi:hypothetical protein